jgi:hypothetical protein
MNAKKPNLPEIFAGKWPKNTRQRRERVQKIAALIF